MTSFVNPEFRTEHEGIHRIERAVHSAREVRHWLGGPRALAAMLLAGVVSALVVVADQIVGAWTDGHLLAAWVLMWAVVFAALGLMAGTARQLSVRLRSTWRAYRRAAAERASDEQVWQVALTDKRVMKELQIACLRAEPNHLGGNQIG